MKNRFLLPVVLLMICLIAMAATVVCCGIVEKPMITKAEFPYSITYEYGGKTMTIEDRYICEYMLGDVTLGEQIRFWKGYIGSYGEETEQGYHLLKEVPGGQLVIMTNLSAGYLMGDPLHAEDYETDDPDQPYAAVYDLQGVEYTEAEMLDKYGLKIIGWEYPTPIENEFVFSHIAKLSGDLVFPLEISAIIYLVLCLIFVKKDKVLAYTKLDRVSMILNFVVGILLIPFLSVICMLAGLTGGGATWFYQIIYCVPALAVLSLAVSLCLRRKGFGKSSLIVQFVGPVLFLICLFA